MKTAPGDSFRTMLPVLRARLDEIITSSRLYNKKDHGYSSAVLHSCGAAVDAAEDAINLSYEESVRYLSLTPILLSVARAEREFQPLYGDDGYGGSTFGSIISKLLELQKEFGERTVITKDQLMHLTWSDEGLPVAARAVDYLDLANESMESIERICRQYGFEKVDVSWHFVESMQRIFPPHQYWNRTKLVFHAQGQPADVAWSEEACRQSISRLLGVRVYVFVDQILAELPNTLESLISSHFNGAEPRSDIESKLYAGPSASLPPAEYVKETMYEALNDVLCARSLEPLIATLENLEKFARPVTETEQRAHHSLSLVRSDIQKLDLKLRCSFE